MAWQRSARAHLGAAKVALRSLLLAQHGQRHVHTRRGGSQPMPRFGLAGAGRKEAGNGSRGGHRRGAGKASGND